MATPRDKQQRKNEKHGMAKTPEYKAWVNLIQRVTSETRHNYADYGGRGITVCAEWRQSFQAFYECVGPRPALNYSIDRKDVNGNYEPGNVHWATKSEQMYNRRRWRCKPRVYKTVGVTVEPAVYLKLKEQAAKAGMTLSSYLRPVIEELIN